MFCCLHTICGTSIYKIRIPKTKLHIIFAVPPLRNTYHVFNVEKRLFSDPEALTNRINTAFPPLRNFGKSLFLYVKLKKRDSATTEPLKPLKIQHFRPHGIFTGKLEKSITGYAYCCRQPHAITGCPRHPEQGKPWDL